MKLLLISWENKPCLHIMKIIRIYDRLEWNLLLISCEFRMNRSFSEFIYLNLGMMPLLTPFVYLMEEVKWYRPDSNGRENDHIIIIATFKELAHKWIHKYENEQYFDRKQTFIFSNQVWQIERLYYSLPLSFYI
jgi:hypothetical protein